MTNPSPSHRDELLAPIDGKRMMADLRTMAAWTKIAGTASELESLNFVRSRIEEAGYRTRIVSHDAFISLPGEASLEVDGRSYRVITHSMSISTPQAGVCGEILDVGEGTAAELADRDCRGRILLVEGIASPGVALRSTRAGALGVIHVSPHEHLHEMCISPVWGNPSTETVGNLPAVAVVTLCHADGEALRAKLGDGAIRATIRTDVDSGWRKTPLLVAELPAVDDVEDEPFVLFSGHHDTWYHGVMDNGSANVLMLEVARQCAARRADWRRGLRLCFWSGHSQGRYSSSAWYADHHFAELERRCVAHVNIDSPGGVGASVLANTGCMAELRRLAAEAIAVETGQTLAGRRKTRAADESFCGIGIPSMFGSLSGQLPPPVKMRNTLGWWWHTPDDLFDKLDEGNLVRDTRIVLDVVWHLLRDDVLPLDPVAKIDDLLAELRPLEQRLAGRVDLEGLVARARNVRAQAAGIRDAAARSGADPVNRALMRASRALVPLDYCAGDRFAHDPALPQAAWPALEPLRRLSDLAPGTDAHHAAEVSAVQARNRIEAGLRSAGEAFAQVLDAPLASST